MTKRAIVLIRDQPHYRRDAFCEGLKSHGYSIQNYADEPLPGDVLVTWNRHGRLEAMTSKWQSAGADVLVAENGFYGQDSQGRQRYALAKWGHNGSGWWYVGDQVRLDSLGISLEPWREVGDHVLVCPQRGIGPSDMAMPKSWPGSIQERLKSITKRPVKLRPHPGNKAAAIPLNQDLNNAWACVVWASNCATAALISGIPVFFEAPHIVTEDACNKDITKIENPELPDRIPAMHKMAWAQWEVEEIKSGEPFKWLL